MSIMFGIRKSEGEVIEREELLTLAQATESWAVDGTFVRSQGSIGMGFQPFHTHRRSSLESQPLSDECGNIVTFDGRLDNQKELRDLLRIKQQDASDSFIALAAFRTWGDRCFDEFVGDWALALWFQRERSVYLARDHAGTRTLYFEERKGQLLWGTFLETFFNKESTRTLNDIYAFRYLSCRSIQDLTPYQGITAVTPAHAILFKSDRSVSRAHWRWLVKEQICCDTDADYEKQFLDLFRQSVERRTAPGDPILAQLSGGMDSSSIVCMSDDIRRLQGSSSHALLDTISYFDDGEPNWNEAPHFKAVEAQRGKKGVHVNTSEWRYTFRPPAGGYLLPGPHSATYAAELDWEERVGAGRYRVLLSGLGGDELLGGIPDSTPQLADQLVSGHLRSLMREALQWSLSNRRPLYRVLFDTVRFTVNSFAGGSISPEPLPPWIDGAAPSQLESNGHHLASRRSQRGIPPSALDSGSTWWSILESLPHRFPALHTRYEYRYPFLDRDLADFLLRVPRTQLLRPGERRSLMRRSLAPLLPFEVLHRRRKAYVIRGILATIRDNADAIVSLLDGSQVGRLPFVREDALIECVRSIATGRTSEWRHLMRAIQFELWLKGSLTVEMPSDSRRPHIRS